LNCTQKFYHMSLNFNTGRTGGCSAYKQSLSPPAHSCQHSALSTLV